LATNRLQATARSTGVAVAAPPGHPVIGERRVVVEVDSAVVVAGEEEEGEDGDEPGFSRRPNL